MIATADRIARYLVGTALSGAVVLAAVVALSPAPRSTSTFALAAAVSADKGGDNGNNSPTPDPSPSSSASSSPTASSSPSASPTHKPRPTPTPTAEPTSTPSSSGAGTTWPTWPGGAVPPVSGAAHRAAPVAPKLPHAAAASVAPTNAGTLAPAAAGPIGQVDGIGTSSAPPGASTTVTPLPNQSAPALTQASSASLAPATVAGLSGTAALLGLALGWRMLRPRRRLPMLPVAAAAAGTTLPAPESSVYRIWKDELDDLADLAALTVPPEELPAAKQRRRAFSTESLARRIARDLEWHQPEGA